MLYDICARCAASDHVRVGKTLIRLDNTLWSYAQQKSVCWLTWAFFIWRKLRRFTCLVLFMSRVARKPVFRVFDQVLHKPGCTTIEYDLRLEISDLNIEWLYYMCSETKGADQLRGYREAYLRICFRVCKNRYSHDVALIEMGLHIES